MERHLKGCLPAFFATDKPKIEEATTRNLSYGLFLLTTKDERDNGCIINTAFQVAGDPLRLAISCQTGNLSRETIERTGQFNLSVLTDDVPFELVRRFGMQTGRTVDKFDGFTTVKRSGNGLYYLTEHANAMFSCVVTQKLPLGTHTLFIAEVKEARVLDQAASCTYAHYHKAIKPKF